MQVKNMTELKLAVTGILDQVTALVCRTPEISGHNIQVSYHLTPAGCYAVIMNGTDQTADLIIPAHPGDLGIGN